ncbi:MAG: hypothetical protein QGD93_02845 [Actinomycetota bacterium]|nr:hypothetical protein [Actinomycetota bacterium]MDK1102550.1 hypothetical protein [Actinomycetota bacterium]
MDASEPPGRLKTRVLFVCTGNICRSAFAEVAARSPVRRRAFRLLQRRYACRQGRRSDAQDADSGVRTRTRPLDAPCDASRRTGPT